MSAHDESWVLVLDDDPMVTQALKALLEEETPWQLACFNRPASALASLGERRYDVVLTDFLMPEMDGISFLKRFKEEQPTASRILLTGYADKLNAIRSINEVGLYYYVEKPWDNDDLLLVLRNGVERARLLRELDERIARLLERDRSLEDLRAKLLKAIL